jgi:cytochrome b
MAALQRALGVGSATGSVAVWDPLVRLFHWSLVIAFFTAFLVEDPAQIHETAGYVVLGLIAFRLVWGLVGPRHARFGDFIRPPGAVIAYLRQLRRGRARRHLGHNPAGGAMIVLLLFAVTVTAGSGWLSVTDRFWGVGWVEELHEVAANLTVGLIIVHLAGVLISSTLHHENLVLAMITGRKRA